MEYLVIGADGQEYGPASVDTLKQWVSDNRVGVDTNLKEFQTGRVVRAGSIATLFPPAITAPPTQAYTQQNFQNPPTAQYPRQMGAQSKAVSSGAGDVTWAIFRSAIAVGIFFVFHFGGIITAAYALMYAVRGYQQGHKLGVVAVVISSLTLVGVCIGTYFFHGSLLR